MVICGKEKRWVRFGLGNFVKGSVLSLDGTQELLKNGLWSSVENKKR